MNDTVTAPLGDLAEIAAGTHGGTPFLSDLPWNGYTKPVRDISDFAAAVSDYADRFTAAGIRHGDMVAVIQRNHIEVQAVACGLSRIGALPVLLSAAIRPPELVTCLSRLDTPYVVIDALAAKRLASVRLAVASVAKRVFYLSSTDGWDDPDIDLSWATPTTERITHTPRSRRKDEWAVVTHTSGTTDIPKLAAHSTDSLYGIVATQIQLSRVYGEVALSAKHLSFVHVRMCSVVLAFLEVAMPILAIADSRAEHVRKLLLEHKPDSIETHPNIFIQWESIAAHESRPFGPVRRYISTFDAIHPRTVKALLHGSDQPDVNYIQAYGQTETGAVTLRLVTRPEVDGYTTRDVGRPVPGVQVRIVDEKGAEVPSGQTGLIESQTPGRFRGYIGTPHPPVNDMWWRMGDIGRLTEEGSLQLLDRIVDHVEGSDSLLEIEDRLLECMPDVAEVVLLKSVRQHEMVAVVCPQEGASPAWQRMREQLQKDIPVYVMTWDSLPLTGSYKVRRPALRAQLAAPDAPQPVLLSELS